MKNLPVKAILALLEQWKKQEQEYETEGLMSEASVLMMARIELEEVLKSHGVEVPVSPESKSIEVDLRESVMQVPLYR
jgi:hypothetical protein